MTVNKAMACRNSSAPSIKFLSTFCMGITAHEKMADIVLHTCGKIRMYSLYICSSTGEHVRSHFQIDEVATLYHVPRVAEDTDYIIPIFQANV